MAPCIRRDVRFAFLLAACLTMPLGAQNGATGRPSAIAPFDPPWARVFTDPAFQIALDTSRVDRRGAQSYLVWMQTRWATPHRGATRRTPSPFNRELIHTFLRCDPVAYKTARTVVSLDDGPPVDSVGAGVEAARRGAWRAADPRSADAAAGAAACTILQRPRHRPKEAGR